MESNYQSSNQNELSSPIIKIILNDFDVEVQLFPTPYIVKELSTFNKPLIMMDLKREIISQMESARILW